MLEAKNLCKQYQPKKGVSVQAIDHVSLRFPDRGMVFIVGKSGSGKSTLLHLLGGLDTYDEGELILNGTSSKTFRAQSFDSYRNTCIGFVFQENNLLSDFSVGANIAIALELQGKKADSAEISHILHKVELDGFEDRRPDELSGGQKQRVAIARALVKNPQIIMADEPTGALDSATGRQVLDTLKKLSSDKLVILVSHDREYAEQYADRIIELADGKVVRDIEWIAEQSAGCAITFRASAIEIPRGYHLTEADCFRINDYLDTLQTNAMLMQTDALRGFQNTDESRITMENAVHSPMIRSKMPLRRAFNIGCSSLGYRRLHLGMTILLSVAAFSMFALSDTFHSYQHIRACTDSLLACEADYVTVHKAEKYTDAMSSYWTTDGMLLSEDDLTVIHNDTGVKMTGIYQPSNCNLQFSAQYHPDLLFSDTDSVPYLSEFCGFAEISEEMLERMGCTLTAGTLPDGKKDEIAISLAACEPFMQAGYTKVIRKLGRLSSTLSYVDYDNNNDAVYTAIYAPQDMIGKTLLLDNTQYTVTGIVDTHWDAARYGRLENTDAKLSEADKLLNELLLEELCTSMQKGLTGCAMVGEGKIAEMIQNAPKTYPPKTGCEFLLQCVDHPQTDRSYQVMAECYTTLSRVPAEEIVWLNGEKEQLAENEVILSADCIQCVLRNGSVLSAFAADDVIKTKDLHDLVNKMNLLTGTVNIGASNSQRMESVQVVGCIQCGSAYHSTLVCADEIAEQLADFDGRYVNAFGAMPENREALEDFVRYCYRDGADIAMRYELDHAVAGELEDIDTIFQILQSLLYAFAIGFAVFAVLLMANFISRSIQHREHEIGILRAIGARSKDVLHIFFSEGLTIAVINFLLSSIVCFGCVLCVNSFLSGQLHIVVELLHFGIRQILLLFMLSVMTAWVASMVPVCRIAAKKPIDAICGR